MDPLLSPVSLFRTTHVRLRGIASASTRSSPVAKHLHVHGVALRALSAAGGPRSGSHARKHVQAVRHRSQASSRADAARTNAQPRRTCTSAWIRTCFAATFGGRLDRHARRRRRRRRGGRGMAARWRRLGHVTRPKTHTMHVEATQTARVRTRYDEKNAGADGEPNDWQVTKEKESGVLSGVVQVPNTPCY